MPYLTLSCLLHVCVCLVPVLTGFSQGFPFFLGEEWRRCCIQPDHACLIPNACLHIICGYLFISFKCNVCRLWNGDKSFINCWNKLFSCVSSARKKMYLLVNTICTVSVLGWFIKWGKVACILSFVHSTTGGHAVAQWLRHWATNWKVAGSIPNGWCHWNFSLT
jgi:hypothetical protein